MKIAVGWLLGVAFLEQQFKTMNISKAGLRGALVQYPDRGSRQDFPVKAELKCETSPLGSHLAEAPHRLIGENKESTKSPKSRPCRGLSICRLIGAGGQVFGWIVLHSLENYLVSVR